MRQLLNTMEILLVMKMLPKVKSKQIMYEQNDNWNLSGFRVLLLLMTKLEINWNGFLLFLFFWKGFLN